MPFGAYPLLERDSLPSFESQNEERQKDFLAKLHKVGKLRPTAAALVCAEEGYLILTKRRKNNRRDIVKGGIHNGETVLGALYREMDEEAGIFPRHVADIRFVTYRRVPFDQDNMGRDGFTVGKFWFLHLVTLHPGMLNEVVRNFSPNSEFSDMTCLSLEEFLASFEQQRRKLHILTHTLQLLGRIDLHQQQQWLSAMS